MSGGVILCDDSRWWPIKLQLNRIFRSNFDRGLRHWSENFLQECSEEKIRLSVYMHIHEIGVVCIMTRHQRKNLSIADP